MPESWWRPQGAARPEDAKFNFATNNDIVGGNSGSPMVNARGEIVGLIVRRQHPLDLGRVLVRPAKNRAIAVHPEIMRTALEKVYKADWILKELQ